MRIAIAADHAGFSLKELLKGALASGGHEVLDCGAHSSEPCDYPDVAKEAAAAVEDGRAERGVLVCGSGIGMCIAANRFPNVRAVVLHDERDAEMSRRHNDANVACLGARDLPPAAAMPLLERFLTTPFEGGRHARRVAKLRGLR
jgi:ribose 5-phosphate isomerase B